MVGWFMFRKEAIPIWAPAGALLGVLALPLLWIAFKTVRIDATGIEAGRPWQVWRRVSWESIARVERRGPRLRVTSRDYTRISFNPGLLRHGSELRESLLLRLPPELLDDTLRDEARSAFIVSIGMADSGQLPGMFRVRPHIALRVVAALFVLAAFGAVPLAIIYLPPVSGIPVAAGCAASCGVGGILGFLASLWLWQRVTLSDAGITVVGPLTGRSRGMQWSQIVLLEYTPKGSAIRVTGRGHEGQVACPGPRVVRSLDGTIYRAYLVRNLLDRHVMEAQRNWLL
jgi:hypothetical protein